MYYVNLKLHFLHELFPELGTKYDILFIPSLNFQKDSVPLKSLIISFLIN